MQPDLINKLTAADSTSIRLHPLFCNTDTSDNVPVRTCLQRRCIRDCKRRAVGWKLHQVIPVFGKIGTVRIRPHTASDLMHFFTSVIEETSLPTMPLPFMARRVRSIHIIWPQSIFQISSLRFWQASLSPAASSAFLQ